jgi:hypothetical protein
MMASFLVVAILDNHGHHPGPVMADISPLVSLMPF